ncbi:hypothetical protein EMMF5_004247 [Cystobasidiomycetes sp. EMM_F5]
MSNEKPAISPAFIAGIFLGCTLLLAVLIFVGIRLWRCFVLAKARNRAHEQELQKEAQDDAAHAKGMDFMDTRSLQDSLEEREKSSVTV